MRQREEQIRHNRTKEQKRIAKKLKNRKLRYKETGRLRKLGKALDFAKSLGKEVISEIVG